MDQQTLLLASLKYGSNDILVPLFPSKQHVYFRVNSHNIKNKCKHGGNPLQIEKLDFAKSRHFLKLRVPESRKENRDENLQEKIQSISSAEVHCLLKNCLYLSSDSVVGIVHFSWNPLLQTVKKLLPREIN